MSGEPQSKRAKFSDKKGKWKNHFKNANQKPRIEIGSKGFLATCNFREKDCQRETFNILNQYADQLYCLTDDKNTQHKAEEVKETDDISTELQEEIDAINSSNKKKSNRFQNVDTEIANLVFIQTTLPNPLELGTYIVNDVVNTKTSISRYLLRLVPVEIVCKATLEDIKMAAGKLFDVHFLNCPPKTFSIIINRRYNNSIQREDIIQELAGMVAFKNVHHKVDLKNAQCSVVLEILKGICCLSVLPNYLTLRKYNISELILKNPKVKSNEAEKVHSAVSNTKSVDEKKI
ncbi:THUMP domain-containing protein 1 like [Pseudolycoriella hygida]|uniref:THUMP domain-containing protein 1 like n=1 Tax=Pseudolycoriella hygida TaxID=35572 RepID=A0A9Q0N0A1_9DIPT|nr:THUMP domain-containing protein 1 like [Pseudolycoriella hygida]